MEDRKTLQDLEFKTLVATDAHRYYVPVLGLDFLQNDLSRRILDLGDKLAQELKRRFSDAALRTEQFRVVEIATYFGIDVDECLLVLLHLKEAVENWSGGRSSDWPSKDAWILPSERIFDWPTTADFIHQLKEWRSPARQQMKQNLLARLEGQTHNAPETLTVPPWHRDLRPRSLQALFGEIHRAKHMGCPALVVLGLRAALVLAPE
ncbi:hypothetical protein GCM10011487_70340 [Steroidobacter agaridevorans]|uniref:Uncharacterized protein n=1 Tax=Steroidobacter agaridevorans TaxID=2695856 RepID=A0A829YNI8_9GAMM|nr:hypothetical protein GCM10011487_70340 [Steroidobacter agaridevorans]